MGVTVSISLDRTPTALADTLPSGKSFIAIYAGGASITLPGFDHQTIAAARGLIDTLFEAITHVETQLAAITPPVRSTPMNASEDTQDSGAAAEEPATEDTKPSDQADGATQDPPADAPKDETDGALV